MAKYGVKITVYEYSDDDLIINENFDVDDLIDVIHNIHGIIETEIKNQEEADKRI